MYKLLAIDIDDTLTKIPKELPLENEIAIRRAQDSGIIVTLATGRGFFGSSYIWKKLELKGPVINYGGAIIVDTATGKPLYVTSVKMPLAREVLLLARELGVHAQIYQGDSIVIEKECAYSKRYISNLDLKAVIDPELIEHEYTDIPKILLITEPTRAAELLPMLTKRFSGRLKVSGSQPGFIELNSVSAHKGSALCWLAEHMGIAQSETAAIGDNLLDIEMIRYAGLGGAVGDAIPEVIEAADVVVGKCAEFGVAQFINILLKANEIER